MNARERVRVEQINRVGDFVNDNSADFGGLSSTAKSKAQDLAAALNTASTGVVPRLEQFSTGHETGSADFHSGTTSKSVLRDGILADLRAINQAAAAIADSEKTPQIMDDFRMPHGVSDQKLGAVALAFADKAGPPLEAKFLTLNLPATFIQDLKDRVAAFNTAKEDTASGLEKQTCARSGLGATIAEGLTIGRQLNVIMKNLYKSNPAMFTAWTTAYHIERVGGKKKTPQTPKPNP